MLVGYNSRILWHSVSVSEQCCAMSEFAVSEQRSVQRALDWWLFVHLHAELYRFELWHHDCRRVSQCAVSEQRSVHQPAKQSRLLLHMHK